MKSAYKIILFLIIFTFGFFLLRTQGQYVYYNVGTLVADLGGLTYLYSTVSIVFAIFAAFIILSEAERWNNLTDAVKGEVGELNELWLWSQNLPTNLKTDFEDDIKRYLETLIAEGWQKGAAGQKSLEIENILSSLHNNTYKILKAVPNLMPEIFSTFTDLIKYREKRIHYSSFHLPKLLKGTLLFSDILVVVLSLLLGVRNSWLNYLFVVSVATLCFVIYLVIDDMDNPTRLGGWHLTTSDYQELLTKIKA